MTTRLHVIRIMKVWRRWSTIWTMQIADNITSHFYDLQFGAQSQHAKWKLSNSKTKLPRDRVSEHVAAWQ